MIIMSNHVNPVRTSALQEDSNFNLTCGDHRCEPRQPCFLLWREEARIVFPSHQEVRSSEAL